MKTSYKIPYSKYEKKSTCIIYVYKNKTYLKLNELYKDYLNSYLVYHIIINHKLTECYNYEDVLYNILNHYKVFEIPDKYKSEYSKREYELIINLKDYLLNNKIKTNNEPFNFKIKYLLKSPFNYLKQHLIYIKYKNMTVPTKISYEKREMYAFNGEISQSLLYFIESIINNNLYYSYAGKYHEHNFEDIIRSIYKNYDKFKITNDDKEFYSNQELEFIDKLLNKLKNDGYNFLPYQKLYDFHTDNYKKYKNLKNNHKYVSLLIFNIKSDFINKKIEKEIINSHK